MQLRTPDRAVHAPIAGQAIALVLRAGRRERGKASAHNHPLPRSIRQYYGCVMGAGSFRPRRCLLFARSPLTHVSWPESSQRVFCPHHASLQAANTRGGIHAHVMSQCTHPNLVTRPCYAA